MGETADMTGTTRHRGGAGGVDAVVVGSGPNGLAVAITLAEVGLSVAVIEGADTAGGGCRTDATSSAGFRFDVCSTVHALVLASPFFRRPAFEELRQRIRHPEIPFAHPLDGGRAAAVHRSVVQTAEGLGAGRDARTGGCWARWRATPRTSPTRCSCRCVPFPGIRCRSPVSVCPACCPWPSSPAR